MIIIASSIRRIQNSEEYVLFFTGEASSAKDREVRRKGAIHIFLKIMSI
jgi:hypothetical protein